MVSVLVLFLMIGLLLFLYWQGRNVSQKETVDKNLLKGTIITDILIVLVVHRIISEQEAELLKDSSLEEVEDYILNHTDLSVNDWDAWINNQWDGIQVDSFDGDLDLG
ncbi:hypothetical protein [Pseudalkalibacillus caeni]|uniref:Uncharacterized protein n=1 Tax=Exobacillus caeni TaxID=2574798 RepID=A0A5R9F7P4_9BACL|nr:hypothetical protein [Pseudalkalibacillus caeni]TLS37648.1 hypothetical protein FCL54_07420 [Pseudalkalibacillus caeni]